jgi:hypothetical protein
MLEPIITDYLLHQRRLVVPTLGAFLKKEDGTIVFASFLNKDDGVLAGLVAQAYGTSSADAGGMIVQYVDHLETKIAASGSYLVAGLGTLKRDANGILFLDTDDLEPRPTMEEIVVEKIVIPEPTILPEPEPESRTLADTLEQPRTLNDLIRERQEQQEPAPTIHQRTTGVSKPEKKVVPRPSALSPDRPKKRGDLLLIVAVVVAILAMIALIYGYAVTEMPIGKLN